jgi:hypothetical protein
MYKLRQVLKLLHRYPETLESARGQSAMSFDDIGGKGGTTGKAKAQKKEELLCMIIDLTTALERMPTDERRAIYQTYVIEQSTTATPQLRSLVYKMNGG